MRRKSISQQVSDGVNTAIAWLLGMVWLGVVFAGLTFAFTPTQYPRLAGWVLLVIAAVVLILTVNKWAAVFPGLLAFATLNAMRAVFTGHALNNPQVKIGLTEALVTAILLGLGTFVSSKFVKRTLSVSDRIAMFTFVFCVFWSAVSPQLTLLPLCVGAFALVLAHLLDQIRHSRKKAAELRMSVGSE